MNSLTKFVKTNILKIGYEESGPDNGRPIILLHGWPDSVRTWDKVLPFLHKAGFHTYVVSLRGFGPTCFLHEDTPRTGDFSGLAQDLLDFADALELSKFIVIGHDWGARTAYAASCLVGTSRITHAVTLSSGWQDSQRMSLKQIQNYWYHWYMSTEYGESLVRAHSYEFTRYIWDIWNPGFTIGNEEFDTTAAAFDNSDWATITLHSYRVRWGFAKPNPAYQDIDDFIKKSPQIAVPTLLLHGAMDPCNDPSTSEGTEKLFTESYNRILVPESGHFPQRQAPAFVAKQAIDWIESH